MTEPQKPNDTELESLLDGSSDLAKRYRSSRVTPPPELRAAIEAARIEAEGLAQPVQVAPTRVRQRRQQRWLAAASVAVLAMVLVPLISRVNAPSPDSVSGEQDLPSLEDLLRVRGQNAPPEWREAQALRLQLLQAHPEWAARLSADEDLQWQRQAKAACQSSDSAALKDCLRREAQRRLDYLRATFVLPAAGSPAAGVPPVEP